MNRSGFSEQKATGSSEVVQPKLTAALQKLRDAKLQLVSVESAKSRVLDELSDTNRLTDETTSKISEVLVALGKSEKDIENERFRVVELEKARIEASRRQEDEWEKMLETARNDHAIDVSALLSTIDELQRLQKEVLMATKTKNLAFRDFNDAMEIAEMNTDRVIFLHNEIERLKNLPSNFTDEVLVRLSQSEIMAYLLRSELHDSRNADLALMFQVDRLREKVEFLQAKIEESKIQEASSSEHLVSTVRQLQISSNQLVEVSLEIHRLEEKTESLESHLTGHQNKLDETEHRLQNTYREVSELRETVEFLKGKIEALTKSKVQALNSEKLAAEDVRIMAEEKKRIQTELENSRDESRTIKKSLDRLVSSLQETSACARESSEALTSKQAEADDAGVEIERSILKLKSIEEQYMGMLSDIHYHVAGQKSEAYIAKSEIERWKSEQDQKEQSLLNSLSMSKKEGEKANGKLNESLDMLEVSRAEAMVSEKDKAELLFRLEQVKSAAVGSIEAISRAKTRREVLKQAVLDKDRELQSISRENDSLRSREEITVDRLKTLKNLLEDAYQKAALAKKGNKRESNENRVSPPVVNKSRVQEEEATVEFVDSELPKTILTKVKRKKSPILSKFGGLINKFGDF